MDAFFGFLVFLVFIFGLWSISVAIYRLLFPNHAKNKQKEFKEKQDELKRQKTQQKELVLKTIKNKLVEEKNSIYEPVFVPETVKIIRPNINIDFLEEARDADDMGDSDSARFFYQKVAYGVFNLNKEEQKQIKEEMARFVKKDPKYNKWLQPLKEAIKEHEGILQSKLYAKLGVSDDDGKESIRYIAYFAGELGDIVRIKKGRSYQLFSSVDKIKEQSSKELTPKKTIKHISNTMFNVPPSELHLKYADLVENIIWDDYLKLNKYEKLYAFSAKGINDISLVDELRLSFFDLDDLGRTGLTDKAKPMLKERGIKFKDAHSLVTINSTIMYGLERYNQMLKLTQSTYWYISSPILDDHEEIESQLHRRIITRRSKVWDVIYPPNHPKDNTKIRAYSKEQLESKGLNTSRINLKKIASPHPDYDFNIAKYLLSDLGKK